MNLDHLINGSPQFRRYIIHRGAHWILYLNARDQLFLGRSYVWLIGRHVDNMPLDNVTSVEYAELREIMTSHREAVQHLWGARPNVNTSWLGNEIETHAGHGHMHLVPRYELPPKFVGKSFPDPDSKKNFGGYDRLELPEADLVAIRNAIGAYFN